MSSCKSADRQTHTHTDATDFIPLTADMGGNKLLGLLVNRTVTLVELNNLFVLHKFLSLKGAELYDDGDDCDDSKFADGALVHVTLREFNITV